MQKLKYKDTYIYIDDDPVLDEETGILIEKEDNLDNTLRIEKIDNQKAIEDTNIDIFGDGKDD